MKTITLFSAEAISASASATSAEIHLGAVDYGNNSAFIRPDGFFSLQFTVTGDGTAKVEYELSNDRVTWSEPEGAPDIATALTKTSGPASDGKGIVGFSSETSPSMKIKVTETGGADSITVTAVLAVQ